MFKNVDNQRVSFLGLIRVDGTDATGLVFNTDYVIGVSVDGAAQTPAAGTAVEVGKGIYRYLPTQAETNGDHVEFSFSGATIITQLVQLYPIERNDYKADVTNLDVAVSTRMATTHIAATAGAVDNVTLVGTTTTNTDMRGTDSASTHTAADAGTDAAAKVLATPANLLATGAAGEVTTDTTSRDASKADVSGLATQASVDLVPKKDDADTYRTLRDGAGAVVQQIRERLHTSEQP